MIYKEFQDLKLSALGLGAMRLPLIDGDNARIDPAATDKMVDYAMAQGINYYDTAWAYHGGNSETVIGKSLSRYPRESYFLASKFPGYEAANMEKIAEIFEKQLEKCQVEYFDFYLIHNVCDADIEWYLDEKYGLREYLLEQKENGRIRHLGFSTHASNENLKRFLEVYGEDMEFCQIQLNWLDWTFQDAKGKVEILKEWNLPIWVMEPVRGGKLVSLKEEDAAKLKALRPEESIPGWAFRFLQSIPEVVVTLSGMSNDQQLAENIRTFENDEPLNEKEMGVLLGIADNMLKKNSVPCTACRYCVEYCPQGLEIPTLLEIYNEQNILGTGKIKASSLNEIQKDKHPTSCVGCRSCESVCPQQIKISETMADFVKKLG